MPLQQILAWPAAAYLLANSLKKETGGRTGLGPAEQTALVEPAGQPASAEVLCTLMNKGRGSCSCLITYQQLQILANAVCRPK